MSYRTLPRYVHIANTLRQRIRQHSLLPNSRLPSQRELAEEFQTTLSTVRQALQVLEEENLIRIEHGNGSFVNPLAMEENAIRLLGFSTEMRQRDVRITTQLLAMDTQHRNAFASRVLLQPETQPLILLERLRLFRDKPVIYQRSYLPTYLEAILRQFDGIGSLYEHLSQARGVWITDAREILKPVLLSSPQAGILQRAESEPAFLSLRVSLQADGCPVIFDEAYLAADSFVVTAERHGSRNRYTYHLMSDACADLSLLLSGNPV